LVAAARRALRRADGRALGLQRPWRGGADPLRPLRAAAGVRYAAAAHLRGAVTSTDPRRRQGREPDGNSDRARPAARGRLPARRPLLALLPFPTPLPPPPPP